MLYLCIGVFGVLSLGLLYIYKRYQKQYLSVSKELNFFKKEKEYYSEAMLFLSNNLDIVYANLSAKMLLNLEKKDKYYKQQQVNFVQVSQKNKIDLFEFIKKEIHSYEDDIYMDNIVLEYSQSKQKKNAKIFIDRNSIDNKGYTCIIEVDDLAEITEEDDGSVDFLTKLPSQFVALTDINTLVINSKKRSESFALLLFGIDNFYEIQTALGYTLANDMIKKVADYFMYESNEDLIVYKMGCDKFLAVMQDVSSEESIYKVAKRTIINIQQYLQNDNIRISISVGGAIYPTHGLNATKLINNIYTTLYRAQEDGESNVLISDEVAIAIDKDEKRLNEEILRAIENKEFVLYYQPTFTTRMEDMIGVEALLRWQHPKMGLIAPDKFLKIAQKTGLIVEIGKYVFEEVLRQRKEWNSKGYKDVQITINFSLKGIVIDEFIEKLEKLFDKYQLNPSDFNLDITEEDAMSNIDKTINDFKKLKKFGLGLSLDRFGTAYSSFKYLQMLPISNIKIDRTLVFDLDDNKYHQKSIESILAIAKIMGCNVIAEGVETSNSLKILNDLGCKYAQGYMFSKPMKASDFQELLKEEDE